MTVNIDRFMPQIIFKNRSALTVDMRCRFTINPLFCDITKSIYKLYYLKDKIMLYHKIGLVI